VEEPLRRRGLALPDARDEGREPVRRPEGPFALPDAEGAIPFDLVRAIAARLPQAPGGEILTRARLGDVLRGRRRRDLFLDGPEYGPADGAAVEISDSFSLELTEAGFVTASAIYPARDEDEEDARVWVRFLAARGAIAAEGQASDPPALFRQGKSHAVVLEEDGVRRLRRVWVMRRFRHRFRRKKEIPCREL